MTQKLAWFLHVTNTYSIFRPLQTVWLSFHVASPFQGHIIYHLCDRIVDINGRRLEFPLLEHLVEVVNTSSSLFSNTMDTYKTQKQGL